MSLTLDLRSRYGNPTERVSNKQRPYLHQHAKAFIAISPFLVMASVGSDGRVDASPRGDPPGFVMVTADDGLAIPDRPGNNLLDSLGNIAANPRIGLVFFVPGMSETLRVNGLAQISFDANLLEGLGINEKPARSALIVKTEEVFFHCGKALIRSDLWNPAKHIERSDFPSLGTIAAAIDGGSMEEAAAVDRFIEDGYRQRLY